MTPSVHTDGAHAPQTARGHVVIERTPAGWTVSRNGVVMMFYDRCINTPQEVGACARRLEALGYTVEMEPQSD